MYKGDIMYRQRNPYLFASKLIISLGTLLFLFITEVTGAVELSLLSWGIFIGILHVIVIAVVMLSKKFQDREDKIWEEINNS